MHFFNDLLYNVDIINFPIPYFLFMSKININKIKFEVLSIKCYNYLDLKIILHAIS